jgi:glucan phosphoethanolaminetransferase (alkaline phosphatase superfamily)
VIHEKYRGARQWSRNKQAVATVIWISFLAASAATMLFFALFDPTKLMATLDVDIGRQSGYAIGFFFFWFILAGCSAITAWLVRTAPKRDPH